MVLGDGVGARAVDGMVVVVVEQDIRHMIPRVEIGWIVIVWWNVPD